MECNAGSVCRENGRSLTGSVPEVLISLLCSKFVNFELSPGRTSPCMCQYRSSQVELEFWSSL